MESCIAPWSTYPSHSYTVTNANILSCIIHQLNINKCITKPISWNDNWILIFIFFVGRLLDPSASSYSSFMTSSFLIQTLNMDNRFFNNWVLHIPHRSRDLLSMVRAWSSIAPIFSSLLMSRASFSSQSLLKEITSFWHKFLERMKPLILGGHSRCLSPLLHSPLVLPLQVVLYSGSSHSSTIFSKPSSALSSYLQIAW